MKRILVLVTVGLAACPYIVAAHGTQGWLEERSGICLVAQYDDGEPLRFGEVVITAVEDGEEFQNGRTDRNGRFLFVPDRQGKWRVIVSDNMGHRLVLGKTLSVDGAGNTVVLKEETDNGTRWSKSKNALVGLSLLFGGTGWLYGWRQRRRGI